MEPGFSPLDEELEILPGSLTPLLHEQLVRLGTWMPFTRAVGEFANLIYTEVSEPTARRDTEAAGAALVAAQEAEVERLVAEAQSSQSRAQVLADRAAARHVRGMRGGRAAQRRR